MSGYYRIRFLGNKHIPKPREAPVIEYASYFMRDLVHYGAVGKSVESPPQPPRALHQEYVKVKIQEFVHLVRVFQDVNDLHLDFPLDLILQFLKKRYCRLLVTHAPSRIKYYYFFRFHFPPFFKMVSTASVRFLQI